MIDKRLKKNYHFLFLLMLAVIIMLTIFKDAIYILLLTIPFVYAWYNKLKLKLILIFSILSFIPSIIYFLIKDFNFLVYFVNLINEKQGFSVRDLMSNYLDNKYDPLTSSFIKLMILNIKVDESYYLYKKMISLSIVYLIVISGFHLMFIRKLVEFIFKKVPKISLAINLIIFFFYSFILNFSMSVFRVFLTMVFSKLTSRRCKGEYEFTAMAGVFCLFCFPSVCFSLSYALSYICTFGIIYVASLEIKNFILEKVLMNIVAIILSLPFVLSINKEISLLAVINSFIFSYFFCFVFIYFFFFWYIWILWPIHDFITQLVFMIVNGFNVINIMVMFSFQNKWFNCSYYLLCFITIMITYKKIKYSW